MEQIIQKTAKILRFFNLKVHLVLLIIGYGSFAQTPVNFGLQNYNDAGDHLLMSDGRYYFISYVQTPGFIDTTYVNCMDASGKRIFALALPGNEYVGVNSMFITRDNRIMVSGVTRVCDVMLPVKESFIAGINKSGSFDFHTSHGDSAVLEHVIQLSDSSYFAVGGNKMYRITPNGQFVDSVKIQGKGFLNAIEVNDSTVGIYGKEGFTDLFYSVNKDLTGLVTHTAAIKPVSKIIRSQSGNFFSVSGNTIYTHNSDFKVKSATSLSWTPADIVVSADTLLAITMDQKYYVMNYSLQVVHSFTAAKPDGPAVSIATEGNKAAFLSVFNAVSSLSPISKYMHVTGFNKLGSWSYPKDISVESCSLMNAYAVPTSTWAPMIYVMISFQLSSVIKNLGPDTLKSFKMNFGFQEFSHCGIRFPQQTFGGLSVPPGGTYNAVSSIFTLSSATSSNTSNMLYSNVPFTVLLPDRQHEHTMVNNRLDMSFSVPVISSLIDRSANSNVPRVYPNPFQSKLKVANANGQRFEVYDLTGSRVAGGCINEGEVDLSFLAPGVYFLNVLDGRRSTGTKIVKSGSSPD